jgi:hypothetical protein
VSPVSIADVDVTGISAAVDFIAAAASCTASFDPVRLYLGVVLDSMFLDPPLAGVLSEFFETFLDLVVADPSYLSVFCLAFFFCSDFFNSTRLCVSSSSSK